MLLAVLHLGEQDVGSTERGGGHGHALMAVQLPRSSRGRRWVVWVTVLVWANVLVGYR